MDVLSLEDSFGTLELRVERVEARPVEALGRGTWMQASGSRQAVQDRKPRLALQLSGWGEAESSSPNRTSPEASTMPGEEAQARAHAQQPQC